MIDFWSEVQKGPFSKSKKRESSFEFHDKVQVMAIYLKKNAKRLPKRVDNAAGGFDQFDMI